MASWRIRNVAKAPQTGSTAPSPSEVGPEVDADEYNMTISMLLTAADLGHSVTLKPQGARTAAYAMMAVKQQTVHANEVSEMLVSLAREVASFSGADITFSERPGHSFNISSKARAIVALLPEPVDAIEAIARRLIDQHDEPWPQGTESDRLHYWRNKAIQAANDLRALEKEAGR